MGKTVLLSATGLLRAQYHVSGDLATRLYTKVSGTAGSKESSSLQKTLTEPKIIVNQK
jgi:hypothetical protein